MYAGKKSKCYLHFDMMNAGSLFHNREEDGTTLIRDKKMSEWLILGDINVLRAARLSDRSIGAIRSFVYCFSAADQIHKLLPKSS